MDEATVDPDAAGLRRGSLLPRAGFFTPDGVRDARRRARITAALEAASVIVLADGDADGLGAATLIREQYDAHVPAAAVAPRLEDDAEETTVPQSSVAVLPTGPYHLLERLALLTELGIDGRPVYVCDLCPDDAEAIAEALSAVCAQTDDVVWFDHHQWGDDARAAVEAAGVALTVGDSDAVCTTDVAAAAVESSLPAHLVALAAVTRDHDLWINEDPRSGDLADLAYWADPETYMATVAAHGPDLPAVATSFLSSRRTRKQALIDLAVERGELVTVGPWTVGVTYGRCAQNEVADGLRDRGADAAVIIKPAGSISIRGSDGFERAHEVAGALGGGGHPRAAGCKPDIYDDMLAYAEHWVTRGAAARQRVLAAFDALETG